jgi:hypothetical protein
MSYQIQITVNGQVYPVSRDVCTRHPAVVHEAMGTASEAELQMTLDGLNVSMWYDRDGNHLGPDCTGLEMYRV